MRHFNVNMNRKLPRIYDYDVHHDVIMIFNFFWSLRTENENRFAGICRRAILSAREGCGRPHFLIKTLFRCLFKRIFAAFNLNFKYSRFLGEKTNIPWTAAKLSES